MGSNEYPRKFVAPEHSLGDWSQIEPYFDQLRDRECGSVDDVSKWLDDYSELVACIYEVGTDRHIKMTCQTDDEERKKAFLDFIENIEPKCKPRYHELNVKYTQ